MDTKLFGLILALAIPVFAQERSTIAVNADHTKLAKAGGVSWAQDESARFAITDRDNFADRTVYDAGFNEITSDTFEFWDDSSWLDHANDKVVLPIGIYKIVLSYDVLYMNGPSRRYDKYLKWIMTLDSTFIGFFDTTTADYAEINGGLSGSYPGHVSSLTLFVELTEEQDLTLDWVNQGHDPLNVGDMRGQMMWISKIGDATKTNLTSRAALGTRTYTQDTSYRMPLTVGETAQKTWQPHGRVNGTDDQIEFERTGIFDISLMMESDNLPDTQTASEWAVHFVQAKLIYGEDAIATNTFGCSHEATYDVLAGNTHNSESGVWGETLNYQVRITNSSAILWFEDYSKENDSSDNLVLAGGFLNIEYVGEL